MIETIPCFNLSLLLIISFSLLAAFVLCLYAWKTRNLKPDGIHPSFFFENDDMNALPWPIWMRKGPKLLWCNQMYADLLGFSREEVISQEKTLYGTAQATQENSLLQQRVSLIVNGERRVFEFYEKSQGEELVLGYGTDLTESEENKISLESHVAAYREVLDSLSAGITIYGPDLRLKYFNHAYLRMFEFQESWLGVEPSLSDIFDNLRSRRLLMEHVNYTSYKKEQIANVTNLIAPLQSLHHLPDGRTVREIVAPHPMGGVFYIFEDVSNTLALERKYNTQLAVQKASLDNLYEGIALFGMDNRLLLYNRSFAHIWGLGAAQLTMGRHLSDIFEDIKDLLPLVQDWAFFKARMIDRLTDRKSKQRRVYRRDGRVLEFAYIPLPDGSHLMSYIDITDSCRMEKLLRERNDALESANKLKSEFVANVSYGFRKPLSTIIGFAELLNQYSGVLNKKQQAYCANILSSSQSLLLLVNDILDLAMIQAGYMKITTSRVSLQDLLINSLKMTQQKIEEKQLNVSLEIPHDCQNFEFDEPRMIQALYNVLLISIKVTPQGGSIKIKAEVKDDLATLSFFHEKIDIYVPDQYPLFESFERTITDYERYGGVGLGIALARSMVEMHNGKLEILSRESCGTTIICRIPLTSQDLTRTGALIGYTPPRYIDPAA
jgi:signal transduction histidine kinase